MRKTDEFSSVFRFRCVASGAGLDVLAAPNGLEFARLGLIIPKKAVATAVARNRVKRLLRESFRLHQAEIAGMDVVARLKACIEEDVLLGTFLTGMAQCRTCVARRAARSADSPA